MVRKLISLSMLFSLITISSLSAVKPEELFKPGTQMEVEEFSNIDLDNFTFLFDSSHVRTDGLDKGLRLGADKNGFFVQDGAEVVRIQTCDTDEQFKGRSLNEIALYGMTSTFKLSQFDNGEYSVKAADGLRGGGLLGATIGAYVGKYGTYAVGHGGILIASAMTGWGCVATFISLEAQFVAPIEIASNAAAVAGGIALGAATGPV